MTEPEKRDPVEAFAASDPELDALACCVKALLPLDRAARNRVLEYLDGRLLDAEHDEPAPAGDEVSR